MRCCKYFLSSGDPGQPFSISLPLTFSLSRSLISFYLLLMFFFLLLSVSPCYTSSTVLSRCHSWILIKVPRIMRTPEIRNRVTRLWYRTLMLQIAVLFIRLRKRQKKQQQQAGYGESPTSRVVSFSFSFVSN